VSLIQCSHKYSLDSESETQVWRFDGLADIGAAINTAIAQVGAIDAPGGAQGQVSGYTLKPKSFSASAVANAPGVFDVTVELTSAQALTNTTTIACDIAGEFEDAWRAGSTLALQNGTPGATTDISGTKIDSGGEPMSVFKIKSNLTITRLSLSQPSTFGIWSSIGKRNSDAFQGFAIGTLLFTGARINPTGRCMYEVQYSFVYDSQFHMKQRPYREQDGKVRLNTDKQAQLVTFFQPFPDTTAFASLCPTYNPCATGA
jgi:hypothetical protein